MELPRKDKEGNSYLSYSQISLFKRDKNEYYENYILGKKFKGNAYTDFGSKVGEALEYDNFKNFTNKESEVLQKCTRLDLFERKTILNYDGFYVLGFIDTVSNNLDYLIDYKTGGRNKEYQYLEDDYTQLCLYAISLRQETGVTPTKAQVNFIRRAGNAFKGEDLSVAYETPLLLNIDISLPRLTQVYWDTLQIAKEIEEFYVDKRES